MKMTAEHYDQLRAAVLPIMREIEVGPLRARYDAQGLSDERRRWDALWMVEPVIRYPLFDELYTYLHDNHIDTALRRIQREAGATVLEEA